ncbi:MAG: hypothetical protein KC502_23410 [Myxococcales bacterium]|nr:hypothetical protein [Myxococcales bacterium]
MGPASTSRAMSRGSLNFEQPHHHPVLPGMRAVRQVALVVGVIICFASCTANDGAVVDVDAGQADGGHGLSDGVLPDDVLPNDGDGTVDSEDAGPTGADILSATDATDVGALPCQSGAACSWLLTKSGGCAGTCIPQPTAPRCPRSPRHALCHPTAAPEPQTATVTVGQVEVSPVNWPAEAASGQTHKLTWSLRRLGAGTTATNLQLQMGTHWQLVSATFQPGETISVTATPMTVSVTAKAIGWDLFDHAHQVASLVVNGTAVPVLSELSYGGADAVSCGGRAFPPKYNGCKAGETCDRRYAQGRCCGAVFYPSAACCVDTDCALGACADGRCIRKIPDFTVGTRLLSGRIRVLWVIGNEPKVGTPSLCDNETASLSATMQLSTVETVFQNLLATRLGPKPDIAVPLQFQWTVLAGLQLTTIDPSSEVPFEKWRPQVVKALQDAGCKQGSFDDYDVVILSHPKMYLGGYSGRAFTGGFIGLRGISHPFLTAHELAHLFGASDLYGDMAVLLHWDRALMGVNTAGKKPISDDVIWAQVGLGDVDRNGVIDLVEYVSAPDSLTVTAASAVLDKGPTLYVHVTVRGVESGVVRKIYYGGDAFTVDMTGSATAPAPLDALQHRAEFGPAAVKAAGIAVGQTTKVTIKGALATMGPGFVPVKLPLDRTLSVVVTAP